MAKSAGSEGGSQEGRKGGVAVMRRGKVCGGGDDGEVKREIKADIWYSRGHIFHLSFIFSV